MSSASSPLEQLDALMWVNINVLDRFSEEFKIELAWLRRSPPTSVDLGTAVGRQLRQLKALLVEGEGIGELHVEGSSALNRARSIYELILTPEGIVHAAGHEWPSTSPVTRSSAVRWFAPDRRLNKY